MPGIFLGVYSIGEAREVIHLSSLKLLQFVFFQNSRNSDRRDIFLETNFAFFYIRKHSIIPVIGTSTSYLVLRTAAVHTRIVMVSLAQV